MKKTFTFIPVLAFLAGLTLTGCSKESDDPTNLFTVGKTKAELKTFAFYITSHNSNGFEYYFDLASEGISYNPSGYFLGSGSYLEFNVVSSSSDGIASGDYVFDDSGTFPAFSYYSGSHCLDWAESSAYTLVSITSGTLSVTRNGSYYEISFKGVDSDGEKVTAYYKGSSIFYNWMALKGSSSPARQ